MEDTRKMEDLLAEQSVCASTGGAIETPVSCMGME